MQGGVLSPSASRLFRVRKTVATMLRKRGYVVPEKMLNVTAEDFKAEFISGGEEPNLERMSMLLFKETNELDRIYVFFPEGDLGLPQIKVCVALQPGLRPPPPPATWPQPAARPAPLTALPPPHTTPALCCAQPAG